MKKSFIISLLIILSLLSSCDDLEQVVDADLPYVEKLIIQGQFGINSRNLSVSVTKSIPPLEEATLDKVMIKDADCKVYYKDKVINLTHQGKSIYVSEDTLTIEEGVEYRLEVKWKDKFAYATTTIPKNPEVISIKKKPFKEWGEIYHKYEFNLLSKEKGMIGFDISGEYSYYGDYSLINKENTSFKILTDRIIEFNNVGDVFIIQFFDLQYYSYYQTRYEGDSDGGIFSSGGLNIEGNVKGNNVFGVWFGYNTFAGMIEDYLEK